MKKILILMLLGFGVKVSAQEVNKKIQDPSQNKEVLINRCERSALVEFPDFKENYQSEYSKYLPDSTAISQLGTMLNDKKITVVLGTWCGDSKLQVPRFYKIMDQLEVKENDIILICVDGKKKAENGLINNLNIERVPTFIIYNDNKELGRIIESPKGSLEKDLFQILSKN